MPRAKKSPAPATDTLPALPEVLVDPMKALGQVSREELVNLLIEDAVAEVQAQADALTPRIIELDRALGEIALGEYTRLYAACRERVDQAVTPVVTALRAVPGVARVHASAWTLSSPDQVRWTGGYLDVCDTSLRSHRYDRSGPGLFYDRSGPGLFVDQFNAARGGIHVSNANPGVEVTIEIKREKAREGEAANVYVVLPIEGDPLVLSDAFYAALAARDTVRAEQAMLLSKIEEAKRPTLQRKALAALTRDALKRAGVTLETPRVLLG